MSLQPKNHPQPYTYKYLQTRPESERWELYDGTPYLQSAPTWQHQAISSELNYQFTAYLRNTNDCKIFTAPFDLLLPKGDEATEDITTVLQPDLTIICDKTKLHRTGYRGTPTLIIEITSPSNSKMDRLYKFNLYEKIGVQQYWIVEPEGKVVSVFTLQENNRYGRPEIYSEEDIINIDLFPNLTIDLKPVFAY